MSYVEKMAGMICNSRLAGVEVVAYTLAAQVAREAAARIAALEAENRVAVGMVRKLLAALRQADDDAPCVMLTGQEADAFLAKLENQNEPT